MTKNEGNVCTALTLLLAGHISAAQLPRGQPVPATPFGTNTHPVQASAPVLGWCKLAWTATWRATGAPGTGHHHPGCDVGCLVCTCQRRWQAAEISASLPVCSTWPVQTSQRDL